MRSTAGTAGADLPTSTDLRVELGTQTAPTLLRWTSRHGNDTSAFGGWHCYALHAPDGVVLVDPDLVAPQSEDEFQSLLDRMTAGRRPIATLLTNSWHERAAYHLRRELGVPVWLPAGGTSEMEGRPDVLYRAGDPLPGGLTAVEIAPTFAGDTALLATVSTDERVLFGGDAILGGSGRPGHWRERPGLHAWLFGPASVDDIRRQFAPLRSLPVDLIYSAHGAPVPFRDDPIPLLARVLDHGRLSCVPLGTGLSLPAL